MEPRPYVYTPLGRDHVVSFHIDALDEMGVDVSALRPEPPPPPPAFDPLRPEIVSWALAQPRLLRFSPELKGGADCWDFAGELFALAHTSMLGNQETDGLLLANLQNILKSESVPTCTGGYPDSKSLIATLAFFLARESGVFSFRGFTGADAERISDIARAALVSGAWVMSDNNPHVLAEEDETDMRGRWLGRDWNPNFTTGALGQVIFGALWFGSEAAQDLLLTHDHTAFRQELRRAGLGQIADTYETPADENGEGSPMDDAVDKCLRQPFTFHGSPLDPLELLGWVLQRTYRTNVSAERVVNPSAIHNVGTYGQILEFDTTDAKGERHSAHYANDAWYQTLYLLHACLLAFGRDKVVDRLSLWLRDMAVGSEDFIAKIHPGRGLGYKDFYKGKERGIYRWNKSERGHHFHQDLYRVLKSAVAGS